MINFTPGCYYFLDYSSGWLIKLHEVKKDTLIGQSVCLQGRSYYELEDWGKLSDCGKSTRLANQDEIRHVEACIKAGKYVYCPKQEIQNNYELY